MDIALVNNYLYLRGGSERVMFEEAELLRSRQATVSFFSRWQAQSPRTPDDDLFPPFIDPESLPVLGKLRQIPRILYNQQTGRLFAQFLQRRQPSLIHAHNIYGGLTSAVCDAAKGAGIPMVMTLHDYKLLCPAYLMLTNGQVCNACRPGAYLHCVTRRCHKANRAYSLIYALESYLTHWGKKYAAIRYFICPSQFMRQKVLEAGVAEARAVYLPNAVDVTRFEPSVIPGDYLLYVGRLSQEKGLATLLAALQPLAIPLAIVGEGPLRAELEAFVVRQGMADRVGFHGHQSGEALQRLFQHAAGVVIPSEWYENAPMTVLEAFAYGKAVIGTRIGGIPEMIAPGQTGFLVTPGAPEELREALHTLWARPRERCAMGRAAREVVTTRFSPQHHLEALVALYQQAGAADPRGLASLQ
jgi:glycosyltransferase involved in cell wall biosynthesis